MNRFKYDNTRKTVQLLEEPTGKLIKTFKTQSSCAEFFNISEAAAAAPPPPPAQARQAASQPAASVKD